MAIEFLQSFLQQATSSGSRSTVLSDLRWFAGIVATALLFALKLSAPFWLQIFFAVLFGLISLLYLAAYVFFAFRSPDALRSEKFTLSKLAIERSVKGDNVAGFVDPLDEKQQFGLPSTTPKEIKNE